MHMEPTHDSYEAAVKDARGSDEDLGRVVLRAGTELEVYQVWDDFRLATPDGLFDIWGGSPPRFTPSPLARQPLSSIAVAVHESPDELVHAYQKQVGCVLELIPEHEANAFQFEQSESAYSDRLLFGPENVKEPFEEWVRGFVFDRVHKHLETNEVGDANNLLSAFRNGAPSSS